MDFFAKLFRKAPNIQADTATKNLSSTSTADTAVSMQVDKPIRDSSEDLLDRASFAEQVANTIAHRSDPSSLVIGVYGPWGDGKTSTLAMIKDGLGQHEDVLTMDYNPWFYGNSTEAITRAFFHSIKETLEKSGWFSKENFAELLKYGKAVPYIGDALEKAGDNLSTEELIDIRDRVGEILRKHGKKIVVFVDDIDRLDRGDIQTLFKLVRLSGNFDHTTYVLAFDDEIVSQALGASYAGGVTSSGAKFLEKIVQVPLHLPPASPDILLKLVFAACDRVATENKIPVNEEDGAELGNALAQAFGSVIGTPRRVKLFDNAISFAVPILKDEVRYVDQVLIEAIRAFYPSVYDAIRRNPDLVLKQRNGQQHPQDSAVEDAINNLEVGEAQKRALRGLVNELFPRTGATGYGNDWDSTWASEKRICSRDYFQRYFTYGLPKGDMSDGRVSHLIDEAVAGNTELVDETIRLAFADEAASVLIRKLRHLENTMPLEAARNLAIGIARSASAIPTSKDFMFEDFNRSQAAIFICQLGGRLSANQQQEYIFEAASQSDLPSFITQLIRYSRLRKSRGQELGFLSQEAIEPMGNLLFERLVEKAENRGTDIVEAAEGEFAPVAYAIIFNAGKVAKESLRQRLSELLLADPSNATYLIKALAGKTQSGTAVYVSDISRNTYDSIRELLKPQEIYDQLIKVYGKAIESAEWEDDWDHTMDVDERVATQFAAIHSAGESDEEQVGE